MDDKNWNLVFVLFILSAIVIQNNWVRYPLCVIDAMLAVYFAFRYRGLYA